VCAAIGNFADDVDARCALCDAPIQHRPHAPADYTKICLGCAAERFTKETPHIEVTEETLREVALYYAKPTGGTQ
jgi:hypothetical protein